jgi:hypothetical protein
VSGHAAGPAGGSVMIWIQVWDVRAEHARLAAAGVPVTLEPNEPWGLAEMRTEDPDGIRIVVVEVPLGHPLRRDRGRLDRQGKRLLRGMSARSQCGSQRIQTHRGAALPTTQQALDDGARYPPNCALTAQSAGDLLTAHNRVVCITELRWSASGRDTRARALLPGLRLGLSPCGPLACAVVHGR